MPRHASSARAKYSEYSGSGFFVSINVLISLECTVTPFFFFDKSLHLLVLCILSKTKKILNVKSFNFLAISTQIGLNFSTNAGIYDLPARQILPEETILAEKMY